MNKPTTIAVQADEQAHPNLLKKMFKQRARIFKNKLNWDVEVVDGLEKDQFDNDDTVYFIVADNDALKGSCRLMPTTKPTLLSEVFGDTLPSRELLNDSHVWECSRFCVEREPTKTTIQLIQAVVEFSTNNNIKKILANIHPATLRICCAFGSQPHVLGVSQKHAKPVYLVKFDVEQLNQVLKIKLESKETTPC